MMKKTVTSLQGQGQFEWLTSPMGLLGCPDSFQRLKEKVLHGIKNIIAYIDDVIVYTATHQHNLQILEVVLNNLQKNKLKIYLAKCFFGITKVAYLGIVLTPERIRPGREKVNLLCKMPAPTNVQQI